MRDKHNVDYTCTGPDRYFEESLQYPTIRKALPSSFINRNHVLHPLSSSNKENRPSSFVTIPKQDSWYPISKTTKDSPTDSPGSNGTHKTSECTDSDNDDHDDDLGSHCGSLTYSVESFALGQNFLLTEEIDEGYHAEDEEDTTDFLRSSSSFFDSYKHQGDFDDYECFMGDPCSLLFGGVQAWFHDRRRRLENSPRERTYEEYKSSLRDRRNLFQNVTANQQL